ncbi:MAG: hypothetical protein ACYCV7_10005 [Acidimicrobiales bacterium]
MTIARSVADVLSDHVTLEVECTDRMYLNLYVPKLQYVMGVVGYFRNHLGYTFASSALMDPITKKFVKDIGRFCEDQGVDLITFEKGQRKDDVAHAYLANFEGDGGVLFALVGRAQEKTTTFHTEKRKNPLTGKTYPWIVRATALVNQYYFYSAPRGRTLRVGSEQTGPAVLRSPTRRPEPRDAGPNSSGRSRPVSPTVGYNSFSVCSSFWAWLRCPPLNKRRASMSTKPHAPRADHRRPSDGGCGQASLQPAATGAA